MTAAGSSSEHQMPPLLSFFFGVAALFFVARLCASLPCRKVAQLPFIIDITHGICPKCGSSHPDKRFLDRKPRQFWQKFQCKCGYAIDAHIDERE